MYLITYMNINSTKYALVVFVRQYMRAAAAFFIYDMQYRILAGRGSALTTGET